jgi:regulator of sigma E protease
MELIQSLITIVIFLAILGVLVVIHEIGHFVTARAAGVRVHEFGIGFPPRAKVLSARGETLYTLNWLPIGGFVRLEGEDGDETDDPRSFATQSLPLRLWILVAGVLMNVILAFLIFVVIAWAATPFVGVRFAEVQPGSPAAEAGLVGGEAIVGVDGERFDFFGETSALAAIRERAGEQVTLSVLRLDGEIEDVDVTLRPEEEITPTQGALGISAGEAGQFEAAFYGEYAGRDLPTALGVGVDETLRWGSLIIGGLASLVGSIAADPTAPPPVAGPVGIATQIGDVFWNAGPIMTLYVAGILSANLAVVNILPFPPLDGGRMLMMILKAIFGRRISLQAERMTYLVGFVFLFAFLIWITGFDILRQLGGGS